MSSVQVSDQKGGQVIAKPAGSNLPVTMDGWEGVADSVDNKDLLLPRLFLMQGQSELVATGKAHNGDIVRSTTNQVLAKYGEPLRLVPIWVFKTWRVLEFVGDGVNGKFEWRREEPFTREDLPWEFQVDGVNWRRDQTINLYALLEIDLKKDEEFPVLISFTRTSFKAGRKVASHFQLTAGRGVPPASQMLSLSSLAEKNDKGNFAIYEIATDGQTDPKYLATAKEWYKVLKSGQVKVDEVRETVAPVERDVTPTQSTTAARPRPRQNQNNPTNEKMARLQNIIDALPSGFLDFKEICKMNFNLKVYGITQLTAGQMDMILEYFEGAQDGHIQSEPFVDDAGVPF